MHTDYYGNLRLSSLAKQFSDYKFLFNAVNNVYLPRLTGLKTFN